MSGSGSISMKARWMLALARCVTHPLRVNSPVRYVALPRAKNFITGIAKARQNIALLIEFLIN